LGGSIAISTGFLFGLYLHNDLVRKAREEAGRDPLTGLLNLKALNEHLPGAMRSAVKNKEPLSLIFIDIDNFGRLNSSFNYEAASNVLQQCAAILDGHKTQKDLNSRTRFNDKPSRDDIMEAEPLVFRYGGDEFLILAPKTDIEGAWTYANKLRREVAATPFKIQGASEDLKMSISAGVAELALDGRDSVSEFKRRAEVALARAKRTLNAYGIRDPEGNVAKEEVR